MQGCRINILLGVVKSTQQVDAFYISSLAVVPMLTNQLIFVCKGFFNDAVTENKAGIFVLVLSY